MADEKIWFQRLLQAISGRERLLEDEVRRLRLVRHETQRALEALTVSPRPVAVETAAERCHRLRYGASLERQREVLRARWHETGTQVQMTQRRLVQAAQTRRTLERLIARLQQDDETRQRREEQHQADEHAVQTFRGQGYRHG